MGKSDVHCGKSHKIGHSVKRLMWGWFGCDMSAKIIWNLICRCIHKMHT